MKSARVLVTGGKGFLGSHVIDELLSTGYERANILPLGSADADLTDSRAVESLFDSFNPTHVIHAAAAVGGIGANVENPGWFSYANTLMGANVLEACRLFHVERTTVIGTICVYPENAPVPTCENTVFDGYPAPDTAPYGVAKRNILVMGQAYRRQYGMSIQYLIPTNIYGPRDHFSEERSHVIPALIKRFVEAKERALDEVVVWGGGTATREFIFAPDAAQGIVMSLSCDFETPINLGTGVETTIRDLVNCIAESVGYKGRVVWDDSKPSGAPRRSLDVALANQMMGFSARTSLAHGLAQTIDWYVSRLTNQNNNKEVVKDAG